MRGWIGRHRGPLFLAALLLLGAIAGEAVAERQETQPGPDLSSTDAHPSGALALALWLDRLGYGVRRLDSAPLQLDGVDVLFLLAPVRTLEEADVEALHGWVEHGGLLVYVPADMFVPETVAPPSSDPMVQTFGVGQTRLVPLTETAGVLDRFFTAPTVSSFNVHTRWAIDMDQKPSQWVPIVFQDDRIFAATASLGRGRMYVVSAHSLFSNQSLAEGENADFVLNLLAQAPQARTVAFEEAHHHLFQAPDLLAVMRVSPWGWAVTYATALTFLFALWGGRRFGPPVPSVALPSRSTGEYVSALAGLLQRARATEWLQTRYAALIRRRIAAETGVRADLPARDLARGMAERRAVDAGELGRAISELDGPPVGERRMLDLVRGIERMLDRGGR